jgi:hypothetical protein
VAAWVHGEGRHDHHVELPRSCLRVARRGLAKAEPLLAHGVRMRDEPEGHCAGLGIHPRVRHAGTTLAEAGVERSKVHLVPLLDRPEQRDRASASDGCESRQALDDAGRARRARARRHGLAQTAHPLADLHLHAQPKQVLGRGGNETVTIGRHRR